MKDRMEEKQHLRADTGWGQSQGKEEMNYSSKEHQWLGIGQNQPHLDERAATADDKTSMPRNELAYREFWMFSG